MAQADFLRAMPRILVYEGGKVDDPRDPGGRTNQGVTQATYDAYRRSRGLTGQDVYVMTDADRDEIYETMYWNAVAGDQLPVGLDFVVFDAGVNSGCGQAVEWLQNALGSVYAGQIDGQIGMKTLQAVQSYADLDELIEAFCSRRLATLQRLRTWPLYGRGWAARISNGQKIGISWTEDAGANPEVLPIDVTSAGGHRKAKVKGNISTPAVSQLTTHLGTAAGSAATVASQAAQQFAPVADTFAWLKYVCGGLTLIAVVAGIIVKFVSDANEAASKGAAVAQVDPDADANFASVKIVDAPAKAA